MKLTASDLRIGNSVRPDKEHLAAYGDNPAFVTAIYEDKFIVCNHYPGKWFEPIPLTEEWLLKFGFEKCGKGFNEYWCLNYFNIQIHGNKFVFMVDGGECALDLRQYFAHHTKYVHQLQNLHFAITGEELTIK